ncbi:putative allantoin permease [compost metagenome]
MALIVIATLSTNTAANIVSPTNDFQNIAPRLIGRSRAVWLTGFIGLALMGHELLKKLGWIVSDLSLESVYSNWLLGYSSLLGPIAGIMVVDYFLIRRQKLDLAGLYRDDVYPAWNWAGFAAFALPVALTVMAIGNSSFSWFYDYGWFTGSLLGGALYYLFAGVVARSPARVAKPLP